MHSKFIKMVDLMLSFLNTHTHTPKVIQGNWEIADGWYLHFPACGDGIAGICLYLNSSNYTH